MVPLLGKLMYVLQRFFNRKRLFQIDDVDLIAMAEI
jgi:hypothetical protein